MPNRNPYLLSGSLPWGSGGAGGGALSAAATNDPRAVADQYQAAYTSALQMNQSNYANVLRGFQQLMGGLQGGQGGIGRGYENMIEGVRGSLGKNRAEDIARDYTAQRGQTAADLTSSGLGNSTIMQSMLGGLNLQEGREQTRLARDVAESIAGLQKQKLDYRERALGQKQALGVQQLGMQSSVDSRYPDANMYGQLIAGIQAAKEAQAQRDFVVSQQHAARMSAADAAYSSSIGNPSGGLSYGFAGQGGAWSPAGRAIMGSYGDPYGSMKGQQSGPGQPAGGPQGDRNIYSTAEGGWGKGGGSYYQDSVGPAKPQGGDSEDKGSGGGFWGNVGGMLTGYGALFGNTKGQGAGAGPTGSGEKGDIVIDLSGISGYGGMGGLWGGGSGSAYA